MAFNVGAITATLGFHVDDDGATKFDRRLRTLREETAKPVTAELRGDLNARDIELYERKLKEVREQVAKREQFKAQLGADYDPRAFRSYERDLGRADKATNDSVKAQGRLRTAFGSVYGRGGALFAAAGGLYALQAAGKAMVGTATDINESITKNQQLFGRYTKVVERFAEVSAESFGISKQAALEYTGVFGNLSRAIGISEKDSAKMSVRLTKLAADLASFNNTSVEDALEALRSGLVGETEPLRRYGVTLSAVAVQQEAVRKGLANTTVDMDKVRVATIRHEEAQRTYNEAVKEFGPVSSEARKAQAALISASRAESDARKGSTADLTAEQKAMASVSLITRQTAKAHGDFARTSAGLANQSRILKAQLSDIGGEIGARLLPFLTKAAQAVNRFLKQMQDGTGAGGKFVDTMKDLGTAIKDIAEFIKDHIDLIKLAAGAWAGYKVAALGAVAAGKAAAAVSILTGGRRGGGGAAGGAAAGAGAGALARAGISRAGLAGAAIGGTLIGISELRGNIADKNVKALADQIERLVKSRNLEGLKQLRAEFQHYDSFSGGIDKARNAIDEATKSVENMQRRVDWATGEMRSSFHNLRKNTLADLDDIRDVVKRNMARIRKNLDEDSDEGRKAISENFRGAVSAVRRQMRNGEVSTRDGMKAIRGYLTQELQVYGLSLRQARNIAKGGAGGGRFGDPDANRGREGGAFQQRGGRIGRQGGGWLGARGLVGADSIEVAPGYWAAPGEYYAKGPAGHGAVINRHQAPLVDMALMRGGHTLDTLPRDGTALPRIEAALRDWGGLDAVFSAIQRPHMLQGGGKVSGDTDFVPALLGALRRMAGAAGRPIFVQSGRRTLAEQQVLWDRYGHDPNRVARPSANAPHVRGIAADITPGREVFGAMASRFGLTFRLGNEPWHVELANAMGAMSPDAPNIPRARITGGGAVGQAVQRVLDVARAGSQRLLDRSSMFMPGSDAVGPAGGGNAVANKGIARRLLRSFGWGPDQFGPLDRLWTGESGWNENAVNPSSGAGGIPQALPASKMGPGWQGNPLQQIRWGLAYIRGRYGSPAAAYSAWLSRSPHWYQQGGFLQGGGRHPRPSGAFENRHHHRRHLTPAQRRGIHNRDLRNLIGFSELFEQNIALAELTPTKTDDLFWLRAAEGVYDQIVKKGVRYGRRDLAAQYAPTLISTREAIDEILHSAAADPTTPTTPETRPPTPEEIAQGVAGQLAEFNAARASLFSTYGSNYTLAGGAFVPNSAAGQAAGLTYFGALTSGMGQASVPTRVLNQTNVFPTPPPEPHLFARLTLHDLQAAP